MLIASVVALSLGAVPAFGAPDPAPSPAVSTAPEPQNLARARQVVDLAFPPEKRDRIFLGSGDAILKQMRAVEMAQFANDPGARAILDADVDRYMVQARPIMRAQIPDLIEAIARSYAREFTLAELDAVAAFIGTPAGRHYFDRGTAILNDPDVAAANQRLFQAVQPLQVALRETIIRDITEYYKKHPPQPSHGS